MKRAFNMIILAAFASAMIAGYAGVASAQDVDKKTRSLPGYVDFEAMKMFRNQEPRVEVFLKEPMIKLVSRAMGNDEPDLRDLLAKLQLVRVQVFDIDNTMVKEFTEVTNATTAELDKKGWERIVRVREENENVDIYLLPSEGFESILGIVVMVAEDDEAVFVNIVGEINPDDVSRLGDQFDIDELHDVKIDTKKSRRR
jgi:hypothetical protein